MILMNVRKSTLPSRSPLLMITIGWGVLFIGLPLIRGQFDFVLAVLLGVGLVTTNLVWTEKLVRSLLKRSRRFPWWVYPLKLGFNIIFIAGCLRVLQISPLGLLIGISTILPACLTLAAKTIQNT